MKSVWTPALLLLFLLMPGMARTAENATNEVSSEFSAAEFHKHFTTHGLLEALKADGIKVPDATSEIESLNELLRGSTLSHMWTQFSQPKNVTNLMQRASSLTPKERTRLNRLALEIAYPYKCPKKPKDELVSEFNKQALQCLTDIKSELISFGKDHRPFEDMVKCDIQTPPASANYLLCDLGYWHRMKPMHKDGPVQVSDWYAPDDGGVELQIRIGKPGHKIMVTEVYPLVASQRRGIQANYYLALGKDVKHLEVPVKAILDKHLTTLINAWRLVDDDAKEEAMMRDLNIRALQCITDIKAKLVLFGEAHPTYRAVAGERIETSYDTNRYVRCGFVLCSQFTDKPKQPSAWRLWDSEIKLNIGIGEPGYKLETTQSYLFVLNPRITRAYYFLELGKDVKHLEAPIKDIIETRLKQFHDQVEKMR